MKEYKKYFAALAGEDAGIYYIHNNQDVIEFLQLELKAKREAYDKQQILFYFIDYGISPMSLN